MRPPATADGIQVLLFFCVELKGVTAMGQRGGAGLLHMIPGFCPHYPIVFPENRCVWPQNKPV